MSSNINPSPGASSTGAALSPNLSDARAGLVPLERLDALTRRTSHLPPVVAPLEPRHPDNSFTETRRMRHDGWTPEKMRLFHERFAECGVVRDACEAAGMSARSAYNLRDRDPLFAAGWEAACMKARTRLADEAFSRSLNGVVDRIYKDGAIVAERHRYDNRLTMSVLSRLDARIDRAEERGAPHLGVIRNWDAYLAALGEGRHEDGMALLTPPEPAPAGSRAKSGWREFRELCKEEETEMTEEDDTDWHEIWPADGRWWTNYPPPAGFDGIEERKYGEHKYRRTLSAAEQAVIDADEAAELAEAEAQRDARFGFTDENEDGEPATGTA